MGPAGPGDRDPDSREPAEPWAGLAGPGKAPEGRGHAGLSQASPPTWPHPDGLSGQLLAAKAQHPGPL